jgi:cell division protein FtsQ
MSSRRRRSPLPRLDWRRKIDRSEPLTGQLWTRSERSMREPDVPWGWRALVAVTAVLECALLAWLWFGPLLAVRSVEVVGAQHLSASQVARAAGLSNGASVISVDGESSQRRLLDQLWIRSANVQVQLTGKIEIQVSEWQPVAAYHAGKSVKLFLLSSQAVVLGPTPTDAQLVNVQGPAGGDPRPGQVVLDPVLLTAMVNIQRDFPTLLGQEVSGFVFDSCGDLTLIAKRGWKVYFGRVLTPEEFATLRQKLSALKAIAGNGNVDYSSSDLEYVNVMNPSEPAAGYKSLEPKPTPGASPTAAPSQVPCT